MSVYFVYFLTLLNNVGIFASQIVLSLYALKLGAGPFDVGVIAGAFSFFPALLAVTAGKLVDRFGSRWPMIGGAAASGLGMLAPYFFPVMPALYVAGLAGGVAIVFINLSTQNLVGLLSTPETRPRNFSNFTLILSIANFLGPLLGGFSIDHSGHAATCLYLALISLLLIGMLLVRGGMLPRGTRRAAKAGGGARAMLADPVVRRTLITGSLIVVGINLYQVYMPVYAHSVGLSASAIGMVLGMNSAAAFVVRFGLPRLIRRFGEEQILTWAFYVGGASLALIPLCHGAVLLALISLGFGFGMGGGQPIILMLMFSNSRDGRSGEALGLKLTTNQLTKLAAPIGFGAIASAVGLLPIFWLSAAILAVGGVISRPRTSGA